jgi:hypothetical protein
MGPRCEEKIDLTICRTTLIKSNKMSIIFSVISTIYLIVSSYVKIQVFIYALASMSIILPLALSFVLLGYAAYLNFELLMIDIDLFYRLLEHDTLKQ